MRPDQRIRMGEIEEKLADLFIDEADPDGWAPEGRERYAQKRGAMETAQLLARTQSLMAAAPDGDRFDPNDEKEAERVIHKAEQRAALAVDRALARAKGRAVAG